MFSKIIAVLCLLLVIVFVALLIYKANVSRKTASYTNNLSIGSSQLKPCSKKPNCVCSEYKDDETHFIEPLAYKSSDVEIMQKVSVAIARMQGKIVQQDSSYLAAEFKTALFGFVDDLEIRLDSQNKIIHFRSASREGHSDLNKNRSRVNALKKHIL